MTAKGVKMIRRNLGSLERLVRLPLGLGLAAWTLERPEFGVFEGFALLAASFLVLNFVFGRCYLWHLLKLNTCEQCEASCDHSVGGF